jgi:hypothetical protein
VYPRKSGKRAALKAWKKPGRPPTDRLIAAVQAQAESADWRRDGGQYVPNPATWLNQGRWDDEPRRPSPSTPVNPDLHLHDDDPTLEEALALLDEGDA